MTMQELIDIADGAYPDWLVGQWAANLGGNYGDGLARFIAVELMETYEEGETDAEQLDRARQVMETASNELAAVREAFDSHVLEG